MESILGWGMSMAVFGEATGASLPSFLLDLPVADQNPKVVVAMSGGVDSSVTLALLTDPAITADLSLDISAVFMRNWSPLQNEVDHPSFETDCEWEKDWEDVKRVCQTRDVKAELVSAAFQYISLELSICRLPRR